MAVQGASQRDLARASKSPAKPSVVKVSFKALPPKTTTLPVLRQPKVGAFLKNEAENAKHPALAAVKETKTRGANVKALARASKEAAPKPAPHSGGFLATVLNAPGEAVSKGWANLLGTSGVTGAVGKVLGNAGKDVISIGELPFMGGVKAGEAGAYAAKGNLTPAKELGKGVIEGLEHGAVGELAQGHLKGAGKAALEHPVFTPLELGGITSVAGRGAGALTRAAGSQSMKPGLRGDIARAGSTVRPPISLTDEAGLAKRGHVEQRTYSKDLTRKAAQVAADKRREPLLDANSKPVTYKDPRGRTVPVLKPTARAMEKLQGGRANFEAGRTQAVEQLERDTTRKAANKLEGRTVLPSARLGHELSQLVASGTIRTAKTFEADLARRIRTIRAAVAKPKYFRTKDELKAAKQNLQMLEKAAKNRTVLRSASRIVENGHKWGEALNKGDRRLEGLHLHPKEELQRAALSEYALAHMDAKHADINGEAALRGPKGEVLPDQAIREHALEAGRHPDTLAYVPHIIGAGRKSSYHVPFRPGSRPTGNTQARTGVMYNRGSTAIGSELLRDEATKKATLANTTEATDKFMHESGVRRPDGQHFNAPEAREAADRLNADGTSEWVPARAFAAKQSVDEQRKIMEAQSPSQMETVHQQLLNDRIVHGSDMSKTRNVVLVPKHQLDMHMRHLAPAGEAERMAQLLNEPFRMAVLPQPRWLTGNVLEPHLVRLPLSGAGINLPGSAVDFAAQRKLMQGLEHSTDPKMLRAAKEIKAMQMGGLLVGRRGASVRRTHQDYGGDFGRAMYGAHVVRHLPVLKQMGDLVTAIPHGFFAANKVLESATQKIAFGKSLRSDVQELTGSWTKTLKLGKEALAEAEKGLVQTATQQRFMKEQYKMLGQYNGYGPRTRKLVQTVMPFVPWTLNSLRFVYWTLPASHTAAFTALVKASQHVQAQWEAEHKDIPPGTLQDALVRKDKGLVDIGRYTPYGATIPLAKGQFEGLPSTFMPQISGAQKALEGQDPFGRPLQMPKTPQNPKGTASGGDRIGAAVNSGLESMVPLLAMGRRLQEGGGTAYANSTVLSPKVKPETSHGMSAVDRTLNPFRPTYVKGKKGKGNKLGTSSLGGSLGGGSLGGSLK